MATEKTTSHDAEQKTVLITGVAGYIGSHTALAFLDAGWAVVGVDNLSVGRRDAVPAGVTFIQADCQSPQLASMLAGTHLDAAVHFAGLIRVDESVREPITYYHANCHNACQFFKTVEAMQIGALVFSSTAAVYGGTETGPLAEDAPKDPASPYGRSKLAAEWVLRDHCETSPMRHVILRYFNVAGADPTGRAGPRPGATHLIKAVSEAAIGLRDTVVINGTDYDTPDGTCIRDYIHVSDLAEAHLAAVRYLLDGGKSLTLNCGYGRGFSVRQVVDRAIALSGARFDVRSGPRRPGDPVSVLADTQALRAKLGWTPQYDDLDTILDTAIAWEKSRPPLATPENRAKATTGNDAG